MAVFTSPQEFNAWARSRLDEMDAGLTAMVDEGTAIRGAALAQSNKALNQARAWRDTFAARAGLAGKQPEPAALRDAAVFLQDAWMHFEIEMENWAVAAEQKNAAFDARARALLGAWHAATANCKAQALTAAESQRQSLMAAIARLEREAEIYSRKFQDLQDAGTLSWVAMGLALKESRAAFERAADTARNAFSSGGHRVQ